MGNTLQAGTKKDDHGGSCNQQPQAASVAPDQLRAGVKGDGHGGSREQQPQATCVAPDQLRAGVKGDDHGGCSHDQQFQGGAADRARNQLQPLGGEHDVETTSMVHTYYKFVVIFLICCNFFYNTIILVVYLNYA